MKLQPLFGRGCTGRKVALKGYLLSYVLPSYCMMR
jgi:hypothetical protein